MWSQLGKAQLQQNMVKEAIDSYIKVGNLEYESTVFIGIKTDPTSGHEVNKFYKNLEIILVWILASQCI